MLIFSKSAPATRAGGLGAARAEVSGAYEFSFVGARGCTGIREDAA